MVVAHTEPEPSGRIVAVVGPAGVGKTTLVAGLAWASGSLDHHAPPESLVPLLDAAPEERAHRHSVDLGIVRIEHRGHPLTLLDVPGIAELAAVRPLALAAADLALVVVSPTEAPGPDLVRLWRELDELKVPRILVVTKCDLDRCDVQQTVAELRARLGAHLDPVELVVADGDEHRIVDVLEEAAVVGEGEAEHVEPLPEPLRAAEQPTREALLDDIVAEDDELLERYLGGEELGVVELARALARATHERRVVPVLMASGARHQGLRHLLDLLVALSPTRGASAAPAVAIALAATSDAYQGATTALAILSGTLAADTALTVGTDGRSERLHQLLLPTLPKACPTARARAGEVVLVPKLSVGVGSVLAEPGADATSVAPARPSPTYTIAVEPADQRSVDKVQQAAQRLALEDPGLLVAREPETHRLLLTGMGATHLGLVLERLSRRVGATLATFPPRTPYRETIAGAVEVEGKHKKQTGGHGQYGVVVCRMGPAPRGSGILFVDEIVGGAIPRTFIPAVEAGIREAAEQGGPHGFPVVDVEVHLIDGKHHPVDSNELSFKLAGALALRTALEKAGSIVLEPIALVQLTVPASAQGDVLGYLTARRAKILETNPIGTDDVVIAAEIPTAELSHLAVDLHGLTAGQGRFTSEHARYEPVPPSVLARVLEPAR